jgi:plasmid stability protein
MAQVIVRDLEDVVKKGLKRRAARHGRSMEEEVREILRNAVREGETPPTRLGSRIAARFRGKGLETDLPELWGTEARSATFGPCGPPAALGSNAIPVQSGSRSFRSQHMNGVQISGSIHVITRLRHMPRKCKQL